MNDYYGLQQYQYKPTEVKVEIQKQDPQYLCDISAAFQELVLKALYEAPDPDLSQAHPALGPF
jgi:hypothetical protein